MENGKWKMIPLQQLEPTKKAMGVVKKQLSL